MEFEKHLLHTMPLGLGFHAKPVFFLKRFLVTGRDGTGRKGREHFHKGSWPLKTPCKDFNLAVVGGIGWMKWLKIDREKFILRAQEARHNQFFFQIVQNNEIFEIFKMFKNSWIKVYYTKKVSACTPWTVCSVFNWKYLFFW